MGGGPQLEIRILGPLEVLVGGEQQLLRGSKQRGLLALLVLHRGAVVASDSLIEGLWGEEAAAAALNTLQVHVSQLRKLLGRDALVTRQPGYALEVEAESVDAERFERLVAEGIAARAAGDPERAAAAVAEALELWRGEPLADVRYEPFAQAEIARLEELRRTAIEERLEAELALGHHAEVLGELEALVTEQPLREGLRGQLMLALYRTGRQADALAVYQEGRRLLRAELGLEPGTALQELERAILQQDPVLDAPPRRVERDPAAAPPPRELRKTVTVLAAELGLTGAALDPEARPGIAAEALAAVAAVVERHEGTVQETAGEQVIAVFGAPLAHEDDAVRAVSAGAALLPAVAAVSERLERARGVSVTVRAGIDTGTVLAGASVAGEVVASATRLGYRAGAGEVLVGEATRRLVRHAVVLEPAGNAYRLAGVAEDAQAAVRRLDAPLVGRREELHRLRRAFERTVRESRPALVTVLGPAGIGKSRLVRELVSSVEGEATVLTGRSRSYGDGSFSPVTQIVRQAAGDVTADAVAGALGDHPDALAVGQRLAAAAGLADAAASSEDVFWAARKLFEALARKRPLVLVFEDIHWAESRLLDLIESVVDLSRRSRILVVCLARQDLLDARPGWGEGRAGSSSLVLEPLPAGDAEALVETLGGDLPQATRQRVVEIAEGNPLFLEQLLAALAEEGAPAADRDLPPTVEALIAARLDRLDPAERAVLEHAAIAGKEFGRDAVAALLERPDDPALDLLLDRLVRRELIRPQATGGAGDGGYRFHHLLVRETAYKAMPKSLRAELHERFAGWLAAGGGDRPAGSGEARGFHLEQAHLTRTQTGGASERSAALAEEAAQHLAGAGRRAYGRDDGPAAAGLLSRAAALMPEAAAERLDLLVDLGEALREIGDFDRAGVTLAEAGERAETAGEAATAARARVVSLRMRMQTESEFASDEVLREVEEAIGVLEEAGDERGLARALTVRAWVPWLGCRATEAEVALRRAIDLARRAGDARTESYAVNLVLGVALFGPTPVAEAVLLCDEVLQRGRDRRRFAASAYRALAGLRAMEGRFDEARELLERDREIIEDLGLRVAGAVAAEIGGMVELLAGNARAAEERLDAGRELLEQMGERSGLSNLAPMLARAVHAQGRDEEALRLTETGEELAPGDDLSAQVQWRGARAVVLAAAGETETAEGLARDAVALAEVTDFLNLHGDALADLAAVRRASGRPDEAAESARAAVALYELKGNVVAAERLRAALAAPPTSRP